MNQDTATTSSEHVGTERPPPPSNTSDRSFSLLVDAAGTHAPVQSVGGGKGGNYSSSSVNSSLSESDENTGRQRQRQRQAPQTQPRKDENPRAESQHQQQQMAMLQTQAPQPNAASNLVSWNGGNRNMNVAGGNVANSNVGNAFLSTANLQRHNTQQLNMHGGQWIPSQQKHHAPSHSSFNTQPQPWMPTAPSQSSYNTNLQQRQPVTFSQPQQQPAQQHQSTMSNVLLAQALQQQQIPSQQQQQFAQHVTQQLTQQGSQNSGNAIQDFINQLLRAQMGTAPSASASMQQSQQQAPRQQAPQQQAPQQPSNIIATMPCRARGLPPEHRVRFAHFTITTETQHGEGLVCSYPQCRNAGIKFRWCAYCKEPVARRNFRARHEHSEERERNKVVQLAETNDADDEGDENTVAPDRNAPARHEHSEERERKMVTKHAEASDANDESGENTDSVDRNDRAARHERVEGRKRNKAVRAGASQAAGANDATRNGDEMHVAADDDSVDIDAEDTDEDTENAAHLIPESSSSTYASPGKMKLKLKRKRDIPSDKMKRWIDLLYQRPDDDDDEPNQDGDDRMSEWLMKVMSMSDPETVALPSKKRKSKKQKK